MRNKQSGGLLRGRKSLFLEFQKSCSRRKGILNNLGICVSENFWYVHRGYKKGGSCFEVRVTKKIVTTSCTFL